MVTRLLFLFTLFLIAGILEKRTLYILLHLEGALLASNIVMYLNILPHVWYLIILTVLSVIGASVGLALVVQIARSHGNDYVMSI